MSLFLVLIYTNIIDILNHSNNTVFILHQTFKLSYLYTYFIKFLKIMGDKI
jgi:hypothetical protein